MKQNRSHAVMAQRFEARESLDDFPTPPWATRALFAHALRSGPLEHQRQDVWEPACNRGFMVRALRERFRRVFASDIADYGFTDASVEDFLLPTRAVSGIDWIITNPPFKAAEEFATAAFRSAILGVALLVLTQWLEGVGRYDRLFRFRPPSLIAQFAERVPMVRGRCDPDASTATSYAWVVWESGAIDGPRFTWIPPCRLALERPGDYEPATWR